MNENLIHNIIHASFYQETNHHLSPKEGGRGEGFWLCHDRFYLIPVTALLNLRTLNKAVKQRWAVEGYKQRDFDVFPNKWKKNRMTNQGSHTKTIVSVFPPLGGAAARQSE